MFNDSFMHRLTITAQLESRGYRGHAYQGRVVLVHANVPSVVSDGDNVASWRRILPQLEVVDVDYPHNIICCDSPETLPTWKQLFDEIK